MLKHTPLWAAHQRLGARLIDFGGWDMPVQYTGIVDEHLAVRTAVGLFDISHMGEVFVTGPAALDFLNATLTNDLRKCEVGRGQYTLMCNETGGVVDDLYVYQIEPLGYLLIVNSSRVVADVQWLEDRLAVFPRNKLVNLVDASDQRGAVAVQGPRVADFIDGGFAGPSVAGHAVARPADLKKNELAAFPFKSSSVWIARTGYTGEDGFEIVAASELLEPLWESLLDLGRDYGLKPCGLGARDTLRTEMCYPLYGHELNESTTPIEAGLASFVALDKADFVGRARLAEQKVQGVSRKCAAFRMFPKSPPPRPSYPILDPNGRRIGEVASGTQSPSLGVGIGLGYVSTEFARAGSSIMIEIRGKPVPAEVVSKPIYRKGV
jgi:aminomethyltransferase